MFTFLLEDKHYEHILLETTKMKNNFVKSNSHHMSTTQVYCKPAKLVKFLK